MPPKQTKDVPNDGHGEGTETQSLLKAIANKLNQITERQDDLESKVDSHSQAILKMVNLTFDTPDNRIFELSRIPEMSVRPFAQGFTLDGLTDPDVTHGKTTLSRRLAVNFLRGERSVKGVHLARATGITKDEVSKQAEEEALEASMGGD